MFKIEPSYVYFINDGKHTKIGKSTVPNRRLKALQSGSALTYKLLYTIKCANSPRAFRLERKLHQAFENQRIKGEWFNLSKEELEKAFTFTDTKLPPKASKEPITEISSLLDDLKDYGYNLKDLSKNNTVLETKCANCDTPMNIKYKHLNHYRFNLCRNCSISKLKLKQQNQRGSANRKNSKFKKLVKGFNRLYGNKYTYQYIDEHYIDMICHIHGNTEIKISDHQQGLSCKDCILEAPQNAIVIWKVNNTNIYYVGTTNYEIHTCQMIAEYKRNIDQHNQCKVSIASLLAPKNQKPTIQLMFKSLDIQKDLSFIKDLQVRPNNLSDNYRLISNKQIQWIKRRLNVKN